MANKYIRHGETYCGDGTTSAAATSNGGVGAWNNLNVFEGTAPAYGALAAGDVVYVRSKDQAGADITRVLSANRNIGSSAATATSWVTWVLDSGDVWSGVNGILKYSCPGNYVVNTLNYNEFIAKATDALVFYQDNASASQISTLSPGTFSKIKNALLDQSFNTGTYGYCALVIPPAAGNCVLENLHFKAQGWNGYLVQCGDYTTLTLINPVIEIAKNVLGHPLFRVFSYGARIEVIGGVLSGTGATTGIILAALNASSAGIDMIGFNYPKTITDTTLSYPIYNGSSAARFSAIGLDGGAGAFLGEVWGTADSRNDGNYPTLNTFLPNSKSTPWVWRVYPRDAAPIRPCRIPITEMYTELPAAKTLTLELLHADTIPLGRSSAWLDVVYIDSATGLPVSLSTRLVTATSLDASTAPWTATTYGAITLLKKKLSITTPSSIKQDTMVHAVFRSLFKSASANDILFISPEISVT